MKAENIDIASFIIILKSFKTKGATTFGMDIKDEGKHITLFPLFPEDKESKDDEEDDELPIKDLKV